MNAHARYSSHHSSTPSPGPFMKPCRASRTAVEVADGTVIWYGASSGLCSCACRGERRRSQCHTRPTFSSFLTALGGAAGT